MSLPSWAARRPVLIAVGCAALQFALTIAILKAGMTFAPPAMFGKVKLVAFASTVLLPLALVQVLGLWRAVGFEWSKVRAAPVFLLSLLTCVPFLALGVHPQEHGSLAGETLMQFVNAFGEELLFRGVIFALLLALPRWQGIVLSGVLFGSMHLIHGYMDGSWPAAISQALVTSMAGMMFAAVRYATGSLWLVVALHMLLNLSMIYSNIEYAAGPGALYAVERLVNVIEVLLAGYVVLRGVGPRQTLGGRQSPGTP
jgi:membrane protease YdiL (CAAX protease family)